MIGARAPAGSAATPHGAPHHTVRSGGEELPLQLPSASHALLVACDTISQPGLVPLANGDDGDHALASPPLPDTAAARRWVVVDR